MREQTADIQAKVAAELAALETPYEVLDIDPAFADTAAFCEKYGYEPGVSANTIVIGSRREPRKFCACVVLANSRLDVNHAVRRLMGTRRLSFASAADTVKITGMELGGVTVFALPHRPSVIRRCQDNGNGIRDTGRRRQVYEDQDIAVGVRQDVSGLRRRRARNFAALRIGTRRR